MEETTTTEIMEFLQENMVTKEEFNRLDAKVEALDAKVEALDAKIGALDTKVNTLPTKSYLDEKIADLKGGIIEKLRKEDAKVEFLVDLMQNRKILTASDVETIKREFEIFPRLS